MPESPNIVIIGPGHPYRGGISDTTESMGRAFQRRGCKVSIATYKALYPEFLFPGKTQYTPDPKPEDLDIKRLIHTYNPLNWISAGSWIKKQQPDLLLSRFWIPFLAPSLGTVHRSVSKSTIRIGVPDNIKPHEQRPGDQALTKYYTNACDGFITLSSTVLQELKEFSQRPALQLLHPINNQLPAPLEKREARKRLNLDPEGQYILFFGLIRHYKGLDILMRALAKSLQKHPRLKLLVVGEFYEPREDYDKLVTDLGISDSVQIRDEFIPTAEMPLYFGASDLVGQPYRTASQSGIIPVAYNYNRPILVSDVGGLSEYVSDGDTGLVGRPDPDSLAEKINFFFEEHPSYEQGLERMRKMLSWDNFAERSLEFCRSVKRN